eukprot:Rhum_TRINITY_DN2268_c0_g1::Rhum_TRINITY_DN2268_c0_g1_i1::g.6576::m.6576
MGCGSSSSSDSASDVESKYELSMMGQSGVGQPPRRGASPKGKALPPQSSAFADTVPDNSGVYYACCETRANVKVSCATGEHYKDLQRLARGAVGIGRPPPVATDGRQKTVRIITDFSSRFGVQAPERNVEKVFLEIRENSPRLSPTCSPRKPVSPASPQKGEIFVPDRNSEADNTSPQSRAQKLRRKMNKLAERRRMEVASTVATGLLRPCLTPLVLRSVGIRAICGFPKSISCVALSPDEKQIACAMVVMQPLALRTTRVLKSTSQSKVPEPANKQAYTLRMVDVRNGQVMSIYRDREPELDPQINSIHWGVEAQTVITGSGEVRIWDTSKQRNIKSVTSEHTRLVLCTAVSPCMKVIAAGMDMQGDFEGVVMLFREGRTTHTFTQHSAPVCALAFSPDSNAVASAALDGEIIGWSAVDLKWKWVIRNSHPQTIAKLLWSFDKTLITMCPARIVCWRLDKTSDDCEDSLALSLGMSVGLSLNQKTNLLENTDNSPRMTEALHVVPDPKSLRYMATFVWLRVPDSRDVAQTGGVLEKVSPGEEDTSPRSVRFKTLCITPACSLTIVLNQRDILVVDLATGELFECLSARAPVSSIDSGCTTAVAGDVWGNLYV